MLCVPVKHIADHFLFKEAKLPHFLWVITLKVSFQSCGLNTRNRQTKESPVWGSCQTCFVLRVWRLNSGPLPGRSDVSHLLLFFSPSNLDVQKDLTILSPLQNSLCVFTG